MASIFNDLRKRMSVHRNHIRDPNRRILRLSRHIDNCIDTEPKFDVFSVYKLATDGVAPRRQKKKHSDKTKTELTVLTSPIGVPCL